MSAAARNLGIENSLSEIIYFLDDDCVPSKNCLSEIAAAYAKYPLISAVGGPVEFHSGNKIVDLLNEIFSYVPFYNEEKIVRSLPTRNLSFKREVFYEIGVFNENLGYPGEDIDFNLRFLQKGYKMLYSPKIKAKHYHPMNLVSFYRSVFKYGRTSFKLYRIWKDAYLRNFRTPTNFSDFIFFWFGCFARGLLIAADFGFSLKVIFLFPTIFLQQFFYRLGIYFELVKTKAEK
jgi:GT2 family glycosyltransferase